MQLRIALIAVVLAVVAGILALIVSMARNGPVPGVAVEAGGQRPSLPDAIGEPPLLDLNPVWEGAELDEAAVNRTVERIRSEMLRSINDEFEASIDENLRDLWVSPGERNERGLQERRQYQTDPNWPTVPTVPGVSGFDIQVCPESMTCLSDVLAEQADDAAWARPMEARIFSEISSQTQTRGGLAQVHVVCRETVCGILLPLSSQTDRLNIVEFGRELAEELGFAQHSLANRNDFQAIYLSISEYQPRPMWMQ